MSRRRNKKFNRAYPLGNGLLYVPAGQQQGLLGQTFYGSSTKNVPVGETALFSPGIPLYPQPNVNPKGYPVQFRFPVAVNTFPVDRTSNNPDIPSFQQLRNLAKLYNGITLCERAWMDMVPRMKLRINLKQSYIDAGADIKDYQTEIAYFMSWLESPDKMHDLHSWIRMALREQTQIDELYIYKRKKRGGGIYSLEIVSGDQMKPLLDDWGKIPSPPNKAYQQYPWGLPGAWFSSDELFHYQESPAADNPYGQSRVERIIMLVNQALRKQKKDLSHFTEGNIPQGIMKVPENATWTPDQIDAFEQAWNALLGGNAQQQVRVRFTQPGMEYQSFEQYQLDPTFDKFIINIAVGVYGMSMQDLGFTEDIHKTSSEGQEGMTYRRTVEPLAMIYAGFLTSVINNDFPEELHGDMFDVSFFGYEEEDDLADLADAYTKLTSAGILGITNASKLLKLPDDPNAPYIGRVFLGKDGPMFLDDMASDKMRAAQMQSQLSGYQSAAMQSQAAGQTSQKQANVPDQQQEMLRSQSSVDNVLEEQGEEVQDAPYAGRDHSDSGKAWKKGESWQKEGPEGEVESKKQKQSDEEVPEDDEMLSEDEEIPEDEEDSDVEGADEDSEEDDMDMFPDEDEIWEAEIKMLMSQDQDEPFTFLERHTPGGYEHDQKTHGDWEHPMYGAKNDSNTKARDLMSAQAKVQNAKRALLAATDPQSKASARAALRQAEANLRLTKAGLARENAANLHLAKAEEHLAKNEAKLAKTKATGEKQHAAAEAKLAKTNARIAALKSRAQIKAEKMKAHLQKLAQAAAAKTAKMQAQAQHKAQLAASKAAKSSSHSSNSANKLALKDAKAQAAASKSLHTLVSTIANKSQLYNALSGRKASATWTAKDAYDAGQIANDLKGLLDSVHGHTNEADSASLLNNLRQSIGSLLSSKGISQARYDVLNKLSSRIEQQLELQRMVEAYFFDYIEIQQEEIDEVNPSADYRRWRQRAIEDIRDGRELRAFSSTLIPDKVYTYISQELSEALTIDDVKRVFKSAQRLEELQII